MRLLKKIGLFLPLLLLLWFCRKPTIASWDVDVVLPVVTSQLNIKNFLGDSIFKADNTGLLNLSVTRTITAIKLDSLIDLPDTTIVQSFTIPAFTQQTLTPGEPIPGQFTPPTQLTFSVGNEVALKRIDVRSGFLTIKFSNNLFEPLHLLYIIPSAVKNGQQLTISETIPPSLNNSLAIPSLTKTYDLAGYSINMTGMTGTKYNTIVQTYTVSLPATANPALVDYGGGAKTELTYANIVPEYVEGYFGQQTIAVPADTTNLDILKSFEAPNFMLSEASLNFKILNEFGCEFSASLSNIKSINGTSVVALNTTQLSNININSASKVGSTIYPSVRTISLTNTNSNILPFLSNLPAKLTYQGSVKVNPLGNVSGYRDFAFYNTGIKVLADINIPLKFTGNYFKLVSKTKIDFANVTQLDKVNEGKFIITAANHYPFNARLQAYLLDDQDKVIDSLFVPGSNVIESGILDNQNVVTSAKRSSIEIPLYKMKIENLKRSKLIRIETYFIMPTNPPDIKIYENYFFDIDIRAELNYRAERK